MFMSNMKQMYSDKEKTQKAYPKVWLPVGTVYFNKDDITDEINLYFEGVWERCLQGEVPVGVKEGDTDFGTAWVALGAKTHKLIESELPNITGRLSGVLTYGSNAGGHFSASRENYINGATGTTNNWSTINYTFGGDGSHNNIQPSRTLYAWLRTS